MITSLGLRYKTRPKKYKKSRYVIGNSIKKDLSKIIWEFDRLPYESYERKRPKHEPTDSYFYPVIQFAKCMIRSDALNLHGYTVRTEMTALSLHVCYTDDGE